MYTTFYRRRDEILEKRSITLIPDIFANSGGVIVSYFEWVQNIQELTWEREQVNEMLENLMTKSFKDLTDVVDECNCTFRMAAYIVALRKLVYAEEIKGIFPQIVIIHFFSKRLHITRICSLTIL